MADRSVRCRCLVRRCLFFADRLIFIETLLFSWPNGQRMIPGDWSGDETADEDTADAEQPEADGAVASRTDCGQVSDESPQPRTDVSLLVLPRVALHCKQRTTAQQPSNATMEARTLTGLYFYVPIKCWLYNIIRRNVVRKLILCR